MKVTALFVYGTLRCSDIMEKVTGRKATPMAASLKGYVVRCVKDDVYPGMVPMPEAMAEGGVYFDLEDADFAALDTFEGEMYDRRKVAVDLSDGRSETVYAYVVKPNFVSELDRKEWRYAEFLDHSKERFLETYLLKYLNGDS